MDTFQRAIQCPAGNSSGIVRLFVCVDMTWSSVIDRIVLMPADSEKGMNIMLEGDLAGLLRLAAITLNLREN